jgi:hypothetical protein
MHRLRLILFSVLMSCCSLCLLFAQTPNATIDGRVMDPSKAVLEGVRIEATEIDTGVKHTAQTNSAGLFALVNLAPGTYRLELSKQGFRTLVKPSIVLHVQDIVAFNFEMPVGSIVESITVEGGAPLVNTESATVSTDVDRQLVKELPLNGRSFQTLFQLTPGTIVTAATNLEMGQFSINGQRADANYFMIDGVGANVGISAAGFGGQAATGALPALTAGGGTNSLVSIDALQEFSLQTSSYAPEFGRTPGGQISILTRSGTNQFHGTAFDYFRNDVLDANDWFADNLGLPKAALRQNDFGGVVGGPILRDNTFFFFSYEGLRLRQPTTALSEVPDLATRQSALPSVAPFINAFPLPTGPSEGNGLAPADYSFSDPSTLDSVSLRLDHRLKKNANVFARYNRSTSSSSTRGASTFYTLNTVSHVAFKLQTATAGLSWVIRPTITNDVRFNWSWSQGQTSLHTDNFGGAGLVPLQSITPSGVDPGQSSLYLAIPANNYFALDDGSRGADLQRQLNLVDTLSWQTGTHLIKVGGDYRRLTPEIDTSHYELYSNFLTTVADFAAGNPSIVDVVAFFGPVEARYNNFSLFAQDTWRATSRLTVTYGLRWDYNPAPSAHGSDGLPLLAIVGPVTNANLATLAPAPPGTPLYHATADNFAPRLGIAYDLSGGNNHAAVVRAGFGEFYDLGTSASGNVYTQFPFQAISYPSVMTFPLPPQQAVPPAPTIIPPASAEMDVFPHTLRQPYTYHWNLSVEESLGKNQALTVGYIGAAGHSLLRRDLIYGAALPQFQAVFPVDNSGYSHYNALQVQFRKRPTNGLEVLGSYTYGHSLDNVSSDSAESTATITTSAAGDYGNSDFDIRHSGSVAVDYQLPSPIHSGLGKALLGGWGVNTFLIARTAPPVGVNVLEDLGFGFAGYRPDVVPGVPLYLYEATAPGGRVINPAAFTAPPQPGQGNLSRNSLRAYPLFQQDFSIRRSFHLYEHMQLQARVEAFNIFNHPNFAAPAHTAGFVSGGTLFPFSGFGVSQAMFATGASAGFGAGFNPLYQVGGPRSLQLSLKLEL